MKKIKKKRILIIITIIFMLIMFDNIKQAIFAYKLRKSGVVILYKDGSGNTAILKKNKKDSMDWEKIIRETKGYSVNQINGSKVLASSLREIIEYDYVSNRKKVIYKERAGEGSIINALYITKNIIIISEKVIRINEGRFINCEGKLIEYDVKNNTKKIIDNTIITEKYITHNKKGEIIYEHYDYEREKEIGVIISKTELRIYSKDKKIYRLKEDKLIELENNSNNGKVSIEDFESNDFKTNDGKYSFKWEVNVSGIFERKYSYILKAVDEKTTESIVLYETERKHMDDNAALDDYKMDVAREYLFVF